ncbi:MAG TPA: MOSC domain-containing protein [Stellaceae bacterium]|nr:MOSC domain-containing protein [Stellaceae bacterium]
MTAAIAQLYRYPIKGLSAEPLEHVSLAVGQCLPQDRRFAIALGSTAFDPAHPQWLAKTHFIMLMRDEQLARLSTSFDPASSLLTIAEKDRVLLSQSLSDPEGRRRIARFFEDFLGDAVARPLHVVEAEGHAFADAYPKPNATTDKYISLINLASIRDLEGKIGRIVEPIRFRANVYFDGLPAWQEQAWVEPELHMTLGSARLRVIAPITRCPATDVNPATAERDIPMVYELMSHYGHSVMGIYAEVVGAGEIAVGDRVAVS